MNLVEEQRKMRERQEETPLVKEPRVDRDRAAFVIINLFPSDGRRYSFMYAPSVQAVERMIATFLPDAIIVREIKCHPENEGFILERVRNTRGVVMQSRTVGDLHDPLEVVRKVDDLARAKDLKYKIEY